MPEVVMLVPTSPRTGISRGVLLETLNSISNTLELDSKESNGQGKSMISVLVLVVCTHQDHEVFSYAFKQHGQSSIFRFGALETTVSTRHNQATGATVETMPSRGQEENPILYDNITKIQRRFADPFSSNEAMETNGKVIHPVTGPAQRKQTGDVLSMLDYASTLYPQSDVLLWEDDNLVCPGLFILLTKFRQLAAAKSPNFGTLKVGLGGSGYLINAIHIQNLVYFVFGLLFSANIDIAIHKFVHYNRLPDYVTRKSFGDHQGMTSSLAVEGDPPWWVKYRSEISYCGGKLMVTWGGYARWKGYGDCADKGFDEGFDALGLRCIAKYFT
jgi:hypothetical protein